MQSDKLIDMATVTETLPVFAVCDGLAVEFKYAKTPRDFENLRSVFHGARLAMVAAGMNQEAEDFGFLCDLCATRYRMLYQERGL